MTSRLPVPPRRRPSIPTVPLVLAGLAIPAFVAGCISTDAGDDRAAVIAQAGTRVPLATEASLEADPAQPPAAWTVDEPLDADRAVAVAMERDPAVRRALERIDLARAELADQDRAPNPMIEFGFGAPIDGMAGAPAMAMLAQQVTWLWTRPGRLEAADARRDAAMFDAATAIVALDARVRRAHARAASAERTAMIAEEVASTSERMRGLLDRLFDEGEATRVEVDLALVESNRLLVEADAAVETTRERRLELLAAIGLPDGDPDAIRLEATALPLDGAEVPAEESLVDLATTARFDVAAAGSRLDAARAEAELAGLTRLPEVSVNLMWNRNFMDRQALLPGAGITLPIFHDGTPKIAAAAASYRIAALDLLEIQRTAAAEARTARSRWIRAATLASGIERQVVEPARASERLGEARRREGVGDDAAILESRLVRLLAERSLVDQQLAATLAGIDLVEAVGGDLDATPVVPFDSPTDGERTAGGTDDHATEETSA